MADPITRPALRWHGGKWMLAPWIISHFPPHQVYTEPFGGAASVLLRKERAYAEVYGDLDSEVVNFFRVLRDTATAGALTEALHLTPFAREEFEAAYEAATDPVERARRLVIRSFMGFGSDGATGDYRTGFRANSNRSGSTPAHDWRNYPAALSAMTDRLRGVVIEQMDAAQLMLKHDAPTTLHFVDPPYMMELRSRTNRRRGGGTYRHELSRHDHSALLDAVKSLRGMVILCGYPSALYDDALSDWRRVERPALADGASPRTEVLWINQQVMIASGAGPLFEVAA
jgi:DNA adenine methylase